MYSMVDYTVARKMCCILVTANTFAMFCLNGIRVSCIWGWTVAPCTSIPNTQVRLSPEPSFSAIKE